MVILIRLQHLLLLGHNGWLDKCSIYGRGSSFI